MVCRCVCQSAPVCALVVPACCETGVVEFFFLEIAVSTFFCLHRAVVGFLHSERLPGVSVQLSAASAASAAWRAALLFCSLPPLSARPLRLSSLWLGPWACCCCCSALLSPFSMCAHCMAARVGAPVDQRAVASHQRDRHAAYSYYPRTRARVPPWARGWRARAP